MTIVHDHAFGEAVHNAQPGGGQRIVDGSHVAAVGVRRDEGGICPRLFEHSVNSGAEVSANGCATGFGGTLANVIERLLVGVGSGRDQGDKVGALAETKCDHALAPRQQTA